MSINNKGKHGILWSIGLSILFIILQILIYNVFFSLSLNEGLCYFFSYIILIIIISFIFKETIIHDLKNIKEDSNSKIFKLFLIHFLFIIAMYISNYVLYHFLGNISSNEESIRLTLSTYPISMALSICLLGPIAEELSYRLPYKDIKTKPFIAFLIYTLIFAIMHISTSSSFLNLLYIIPYIFLSLSFSYPFYKTNNIFTSIFFHILNNTFTVFILLTFGG